MRDATQHAQHQAEALGENLRRMVGGQDENTALLKKRINHKDDFHAKRKRCITNPDRALETLGPYARLELIIQAGQNLLPRDSWTGAAYCDSKVKVYVDDVDLQSKATYVVRSTTQPLWQHATALDVVSPLSMVRLQVVDDHLVKEVEQGFVEFCIGDIPFDVPIAGWLELRFQETLKHTSTQRYASHCAMREDELNISNTDVGTLASQISTRDAKSNSKGAISAQELKARRSISEHALAKTRTMMHGCAHGCMQSGPSTAKGDVDRGNAGEIYVQLRLVKCVPDLTANFALALDQPVPKNFGDYVLQDEKDAERRSLDLQKCMDVITEVRMRFVEDFALCIYYYCWYVASWRAPLLSFPLFLVAMGGVIHFYFWSIMWPGVVAALLFVNSWEEMRKSMTRGGLNASFTDDGLRRVAQWRKSNEMFLYLKRIVEMDMNGSVVDQAKLRRIAQKVARDGVPLVTLTELRGMLTSEKDMITVDLVTKWDHFRKGDLVVVDERHMAEVVQVSGSQVTVAFNDPAEPLKEPETDRKDEDSDPRRRQPPAQHKTTIIVDAARVRRRQTVHFYQTWLLPSSLQNTIMDVMENARKVQESAILPVIDLVTDILCWKKRKCVALAITCGLAVLCALFIHMGIEYETELNEKKEGHSDDGQGEISEFFAWLIISCLRNVDNMISLALVFFCLVFPARWFVGFRSVGRIVMRMGAKRNAPHLWSFFREDEQLRQELESLTPAESEWDQFKTFMGKAAVPDFKMLQQRLGSLKGMAKFKLPDMSHPTNTKKKEDLLEDEE